MAYIYVTIIKDFERFRSFAFETSFLENKNLFKKLEHRFLVEIATIENAIFPPKTALRKANVNKTNRMASIQWNERTEFCH